MAETSNQKLILTYSIFIGLTRFIPLPVLDDIAKTHFQRRLVRKLGDAHSQSLTPQSIETLADDPGSGCLGCVATILVFPLKFIFRVLFLLLEWKKLVDQVSHSYHHGYLVDFALRQRWIEPAGSRSAADVRAAIDQVCRTAPIKPIESAVGATLQQSKAGIKHAAGYMRKTLGKLGRNASREQVEQAIDSVERAESEEVGGLAERLQRSIERVPQEHFQQLRSRLAERLGFAPGGSTNEADR
jgi:hypothetical protein